MKTISVQSYLFRGGSVELELRAGLASPEVEKWQSELVGRYPAMLPNSRALRNKSRVGDLAFVNLALSEPGERLFAVYYVDDTGSRKFWNALSFAYHEREIPVGTIKQYMALGARDWVGIGEQLQEGKTEIPAPEAWKNAYAEWDGKSDYAFHLPMADGHLLQGECPADWHSRLVAAPAALGPHTPPKDGQQAGGGEVSPSLTVSPGRVAVLAGAVLLAGYILYKIIS